MISRGCTKACVIKDLKIPKDSPILIPVYSVQRDPAVFPDPEKFDPERFAPSAKQSRNPYSFLPFGHGPHSCIGMRFAKMQIRLVLARMLRKYRLEVTPDTKIPPDIKAKATLGSPEINLRIVSRTKETWKYMLHCDVVVAALLEQLSTNRLQYSSIPIWVVWADNGWSPGSRLIPSFRANHRRICHSIIGRFFLEWYSVIHRGQTIKKMFRKALLRWYLAQY